MTNISPALQSAIAAFLPIAEGNNWHTQDGAFQWCGDASEAFAGFAMAFGLETTVEGFNGLPQEAIDAIEKLGHPGLIDDEGTGHTTVAVEGVFVDWTARQFYPDKPFPTIWTIEELNAAGWQIVTPEEE
jgi:hypothetical protein